jgi:hypothetical protein
LTLPVALVEFGRRPWLDSPAARGIALAATVTGILFAAVFNDAVANPGWLAPMTATLAALVVLLGLTVRWPRPGATEVGLVLLCAASLWPRVAHLQPGIPGAVLFTIAAYGIGRLSGMRPRMLALLLLGAGTIVALLAIAQSIPGLAPLIPFDPMQYGRPFISARPTGLYNNPNTLGLCEALILVMAAVVRLPLGWGETRRDHARAAAMGIAVAQCLVAIGLSASRESVLGLVAGLTALALARRDDLRGRARTLLPLAVVLGLALAELAVVQLVSQSGTAGRFNPLTITTDHNWQDRLTAWRITIGFIVKSPLLGYSTPLPIWGIDSAYLEWMLVGGVIGLIIWVAGLVTVVPRAARSLLVAILVVGIFANPFAVGPIAAILLISCGALASYPLEAPAYSATGSPRMLKPPST